MLLRLLAVHRIVLDFATYSSSEIFSTLSFLKSSFGSYALICHFRFHRLRLSAVPLLRGRRRVPGLLQRLRPQLAAQREDQVERRDQEAPPRRPGRPLRHGRRLEVTFPRN